MPRFSIFGMSNDVYCFTASTISVYIDGSPFTMEISCCTNMLPNSVSKAMTITARPIRLTADARPRFQPCRTIETTSGSTASAMNIEMTTSSTMVDILPHDVHTKIAANTAMTVYNSARPHQSGGRRESPLAGNTDAKSSF